MSADQDLLCINNILKESADDYMKSNKPKTRADSNKSDDSPLCSPEFVQVLISEAVKQLIQRQDNTNTEILSSRDERIDKLEAVVLELKNEIRELRQSIDDVSQYNRRDNLKIIGVPYKKDEDVIKIVKDIAKHTTGEELHDSEISVAHRIMSKQDREKLDNLPSSASASVTPKNAPSIIVKFARRNTKTKVFESRKQTVAKPHCPYPKAEIYEDVTPLRSRILYALRNKKDSNDVKLYRYVWSREGRIYCRTDAETKVSPQPPPHIINCPQDLLKLGWIQNEIEEIIHKKNY